MNPGFFNGVKPPVDRSRRRKLGAALVPVPLGGAQLGGVGSKTGTSSRSRRDDWSG